VTVQRRARLDRLARDARTRRRLRDQERIELEAQADALLEELENPETRRRIVAGWEQEIEAGDLPNPPPDCSSTHEARSCEVCRSWQDSAHRVFIERCVDSSGALTTAGDSLWILAKVYKWPLRDDTWALLDSR
jgi:hypothetical protein